MYKITVRSPHNTKTIYANSGELLYDVLMGSNINMEHPCGGKGICKKCTVWVNGESVLSCRYKITGDIKVEIPSSHSIATTSANGETGHITDNMCLCLDIGTTTLALALVSTDEQKIIKTKICNNPQRAFAADVMSRIDYATKNGIGKLHSIITEEVCRMTNELFEETGLTHINTLYVAGNTTMLHLFFGVPCNTLGYAPYTPVFLQSQKISAERLNLKNIDTVISLDCISSFVGADITAGLLYVNEPCDKKYNILIDLGTNAEIALYSQHKLYCTAAAAGPCFEGVNISCGMSATEGAVYSYTGKDYHVIGNVAPRGICATGLIDIIAVLLDNFVIDSTGFMEDGDFEIFEDVSISQKDIRQFQLAKSAIYSATLSLIKKTHISFEDIETVFISGGFSSKLNIDNALKVGLLPKEFKGKIQTGNNSCLLGLVKYACNDNNIPQFLKNAEYVDLATDEYFQELFIEKMMF